MKIYFRLLASLMVLISFSARAGFLDTLEKYATNSVVTNVLGTNVLGSNSTTPVQTNSSAGSAVISSPATNRAMTTSSNATSTTNATLSGLSQSQLSAGIKQALSNGVQNAVAQLGHENGFLTNLNVRIPMPEKLRSVETTLRSMHEDKLADEFVAAMNHAAEQAVPQATTVFANAVGQISIADAQSILTGPNDAATQFFRRTTETNLFQRFLPTVQKTTGATGVTATYKKMMSTVTGSNNAFAKAVGNLLGPQAVDLDSYVTQQALDGLFKMIANEEAKIRANPAARTSELLQKVFGAVKSSGTQATSPAQ